MLNRLLKIEITGYKSVRTLTLEFTQNITVIEGKFLSGKTNILECISTVLGGGYFSTGIFSAMCYFSDGSYCENEKGHRMSLNKGYLGNTCFIADNFIISNSRNTLKFPIENLTLLNSIPHPMTIMEQVHGSTIRNDIQKVAVSAIKDLFNINVSTENYNKLNTQMKRVCAILFMVSANTFIDTETGCKGIVVIDDFDTSLSKEVAMRLIQVFAKYFPNVQFILSSKLGLDLEDYYQRICL